MKDWMKKAVAWLGWVLALLQAVVNSPWPGS